MKIVFFFTMANINKKFGVNNRLNEILLNVMVTLFSIASGLSNLGTGILTDYVSIKLILSVMAQMNVIY